MEFPKTEQGERFVFLIDEGDGGKWAVATWDDLHDYIDEALRECDEFEGSIRVVKLAR